MLRKKLSPFSRWLSRMARNRPIPRQADQKEHSEDGRVADIEGEAPVERPGPGTGLARRTCSRGISPVHLLTDTRMDQPMKP